MEALKWQKSSYSGSNGGACIEIARLAAGIAVRDSKVPGYGRLTISVDAFQAFLACIKDDVTNGA
ncbi:DUF397 domain-containing protein [Sphaerisporangium rubeum]|uniref:DUF397 domain-containing protein n=1 Tax=Sphaerisporangium rubeum TaxID=321317 RepID=A0A7X0M976_9ACTN|nr:DUF397 domain-containing protein [Sphaerisporangium rubeum]MBB6474651.1 hypothetical protein [Sphaerisporangium rubeum]